MTVKITKPSINVRSELSELRKPSGTAGEAMLRAETPQEQQELIGVGRRNMIINGGFDIWQRGTSVTATSSGYSTADRWAHNASGGTLSLSRQNLTVGQTEVPVSLKYFYRLNATTGNNNAGFFQKVEGVDRVQGNITLSFYAKGTNPGGGSFELELRQNFGSTGSGEVYSLTEFSITPEWKRYVITLTVPSILGKTISGTGDNFRLYFRQPDNDTSTNAWTLDITGVQMELGKVATPFEHRSYGEELALCQRYYETGTHKSRGYAGDTGSGYCQRNMPDVFKVTKRANPTVSISGVSSLGSDVDLDRVTFSTYTVNAGNAFTVHDYTWTADAEL